MKVRKEMSPFFNFPEDKTPAEKETRKKKLADLNESLKARNSSRSIKPRRQTNCSVASLLARRKCNWTGS
jgi:hypothetical protein